MAINLINIWSEKHIYKIKVGRIVATVNAENGTSSKKFLIINNIF